jgi:polyhydroxyalkanoate synthesis regulator phasin
VSDERTGQRSPLPDALRTAIERTLAATASSASETRGRAQELLDEVARRGQEARAALRVASREDVSGLAERLDSMERRLRALEAELERVRAEADPKVEG